MQTLYVNSRVEDRLMNDERGPYDITEYMDLPEDGPRYQLIRGWLVREPAPSEKHQSVVGNLYVLLRRWVDARRLGRVYIAPFDTVLSSLDVVQPDLLFISLERLGQLNPKNLQGGPDLVVEVLSPSTKRRDATVKIQLYQAASVREAWLVDPEAEQVEVLDLQDPNRRSRHFANDALLESGVFGALDFTAAELFAYVV